MYTGFYGLSERPFSLLPDPDYLYLSKEHSIALAVLEYALTCGVGCAVVTGDVGCGKTTLVRQILNGIGNDLTVGLISNTHRSFGELLDWVSLAFNLDVRDKRKPELYYAFVEFMIRQFAEGKRTVLIVDEAQNMDAQTLEELRLLTNVNADKDQMLQLVLVGQPELRETMHVLIIAMLTAPNCAVTALDFDRFGSCRQSLRCSQEIVTSMIRVCVTQSIILFISVQ